MKKRAFLSLLAITQERVQPVAHEARHGPYQGWRTREGQGQRNRACL